MATGGVTLIVDGVEANSAGVSASAIQELKINQNPYTAEFSRPGRGRIEIITKPGSTDGAFNFLFRHSSTATLSFQRLAVVQICTTVDAAVPAYFRHGLAPQLFDPYPHLRRLGPVRMMLQEIFQLIRRCTTVPPPQVNFRQRQLGM